MMIVDRDFDEKKRGEWERERARRILNKRQKNPHDLWVGRTLKKNITTKKFCVWKERIRNGCKVQVRAHT